MDQSRRRALTAGGALGVFGLLLAAGMLAPREAQAAWNRSAFDAKSMEAALEAIGAGAPGASGAVVLTTVEVAEDGTVVPVTVTSTLPDTRQIAILVENNPNPLAASFTFPDGTVPEIHTRVKMADTSKVFGVVKAGDAFYMVKTEVKVVEGGCA